MKIFTIVLLIQLLVVNLIAKSSDIAFNQNFIESVNSKSIYINNFNRVLSFVISKMDDNITVYPTEGYYYFEFMNNGEKIRGNLRFDFIDRDKGEATFAYFKEINRSNNKYFFKVLNRKNGFILTKTDKFKYHLKYKNFKKDITIYDAKKELANLPKFLKNENYIGPIFDESGIRFHFVYDNVAKTFLYILNTTLGFSETYSAIDRDNNLLIGNRTKFIYFNDKKRKRYILVGVEKKNIDSNSYYDGPFDQLPDSFMDGKKLKSYIIDYDPSVKNLITDFGIYKNEITSRYAVESYLEYTNKNELFRLYKCLDKDNISINKCIKDALEL